MPEGGEDNRMSNLEKAEEIAEKLRREPYHLFGNDGITKSLRLKRKCKALGIPVRVVACVGLAKARLLGHWFTVPVVHSWGEVEGKRIEVSRPHGSSGIWGIVPVTIRPVVSIRF